MGRKNLVRKYVGPLGDQDLGAFYDVSWWRLRKEEMSSHIALPKLLYIQTCLRLFTDYLDWMPLERAFISCLNARFVFVVERALIFFERAFIMVFERAFFLWTRVYYCVLNARLLCFLNARLFIVVERAFISHIPVTLVAPVDNAARPGDGDRRRSRDLSRLGLPPWPGLWPRFSVLLGRALEEGFGGGLTGAMKCLSHAGASSASLVPSTSASGLMEFNLRVNWDVREFLAILPNARSAGPTLGGDTKPREREDRHLSVDFFLEDLELNPDTKKANSLKLYDLHM